MPNEIVLPFFEPCSALMEHMAHCATDCEEFINVKDKTSTKTSDACDLCNILSLIVSKVGLEETGIFLFGHEH